MATKLLKPVTRELMARNLRGKNLIATLEPGDVIEFRPKGTRQRYWVSLHSVYALAQLVTFNRMYEQKLKAYDAAKKSGRKVKRPKRPVMPVDKILIRAAQH